MNKYDFNLLYDKEFQYLGLDLVGVRENYDIECFNFYKDNGIDGLFYNEKDKIVIQCKKYKNYQDLKYDIKNDEISKLEKIKPERYILVVSTDITFNQKEELLNILSKYVRNRNDIIAKEDIIKYFRNKKYLDVKSQYISYLNPSYDEYKNMLETTINKHINTKTEWLVQDIKEDKKFFVSTSKFSKIKKALNESKVILLTGDPGSGKTTNARMLIDYLYSTRQVEEFYEVDKCNEILNFIDDNVSQAFFIDDFWGSKFILNNFERNEEKDLLRIIEKINNSSNSYLILTSREYVLQQGMNDFKNFKSMASEKRIFFNNNNYTDLEKTKILINHANYSNLNSDYIMAINYAAKQIISLPNYSPMYVSNFIKNKSNYNKSPKDFIKEFIKYIENPKDYFDDYFHKLSFGAQTLAFLIAISPDMFKLEYLKESFICISRNMSLVRPSEFDLYFHELENSWLDIKFRDKTVRFLNHSIEDYVLENLLIKFIDFSENWIKNLPYFSQLFNIMLEQKFNLTDYDKNLIIDRLIKDYDTLKVCEDYDYDFIFGNNKHMSEHNILWQYLRFNKIVKSSKLIDFIKLKVEDLIEYYSVFMPQPEDMNFISIPELVKFAESQGALFDEDIILKYFKSCYFLMHFYWLKTLPNRFHKIIDTEIKKRFNMTEDMFIDWLQLDLKILSTNGITMDYDMTLDKLPDIVKIFNLKMTSNIKKIVEQYSNYYNFKVPVSHKNLNPKNKDTNKLDRFLLNHYLYLKGGDEENESQIKYISNNKFLNDKHKKIIIDFINEKYFTVDTGSNIRLGYLKFIISFLKDNPKTEKLDWYIYPKFEQYILLKLEENNINFLYKYAYYLKTNDDNVLSENNFLKTYKITKDLLNKLINLGILRKSYNLIMFSDYHFETYMTVMYFKSLHILNKEIYLDYFSSLTEVNNSDFQMFDTLDTNNFRKYYLIPIFEKVIDDINNNKDLFYSILCDIDLKFDKEKENDEYCWSCDKYYTGVNNFLWCYEELSITDDIVKLFLENTVEVKGEIKLQEFISNKNNKDTLAYQKILELLDSYGNRLINVYNKIKNTNI